jgi:hypothetical protein
MKCICLYDTTSGPITESATEPQLVPCKMIKNSIAANYYLTSRTIRTEKRKEFRDFFEEISKCAYDIQICFARTLLNKNNIHDEAIKITELESRIVILQRVCQVFCVNSLDD